MLIRMEGGGLAFHGEVTETMMRGGTRAPAPQLQAKANCAGPNGLVSPGLGWGRGTVAQANCQQTKHQQQREQQRGRNHNSAI
ncbi:hypothetical protein GCM10028822_08310 [Hymenobacter terrigena]